MIDTVKLRIDNPEIPPDIYDNFEPSARDFYEKPYAVIKKYAKRSLILPKEDRLYGIYLPRITLYKAARTGGYTVFMNIEFSAPKILFNNNFDELTNTDFIPLCQKLSEKLEYLGLKISPTKIANTHVHTIHYGKNILTGYTLAKDIIAELSKINITTTKDFEEKGYMNGGTSLYLHTLKHGLVFYDKVAELQKSKKQKQGLIEKDYYCQSTLFNEKPPPKPFEVVRMEARYVGKDQIKKLTTNIGLDLPNDFRFADLFSSSISQKALLYEFEEIKRGNFAFADSDTTDVADFARQIKIQNPNVSARNLANATLLFVLSQQYSGREIRNMLGFNSNQWSHFVKSVEDIKYDKRVANGFDILERGLKDFTPVRFSE